MSRTTRGKDKYCFPDALKSKLSKILDQSLTVVEAPAGFGKTTAIRNFLEPARHCGADIKWYTCLGESPGKAWAGICELFRDAGDSTAEELLELGVPAPDKLPDIAAIVANIRREKPGLLVIDNYQLFKTDVQKKLLAALSARDDANLRLIVITQPLKNDGESGRPADPNRLIGSDDFFFDNDCISKYCRLTGLKISRASIEQIQLASRGWIAAIRLQLKSYQDTGLFMGSRDINALVETAIWNKLSDAEKDFMLSLALLDGFTAEQAAIMGGGAAPDSVTNLMSLDFFIRYVADKKVYSMHAILRDYLLNRFEMRPKHFTDAAYRQAARAAQAVADYFQAALFLEKVDDYDAILALPFTTKYFYNNKERDLVGFFGRLVDKCPRETLQKHPILLVLLGYHFFMNGLRPLFLKTAEIIEELLENPRGLPADELARTRAEFAILMSFPQSNDIAKMSVYHREAYEQLKSLSETPISVVFGGSIPWTLGTASVLCIYWRLVGELEHELDVMDECLPIYSALASGHGAGAEHVFRAEAALARGDDALAEAMCHKAIQRADGAGQFAVSLCAELVLGKTAILRGDAQAYAAVRKSIAENAKEARQRSVFRIGELCLAEFDLDLGRTGELPHWLRDIDGMKKVIYAHSIPYGFMLYGHLLLHEERYAELYGLTDHVMDISREKHRVLPQLSHTIYLAVARARQGDAEQALAHLKDALALALTDRMYLPFAKFAADLQPLLKTLKGQTKYAGLNELTALCERYALGAEAVIEALRSGSASPLAPREREVALLAKARLSAHEISARLGISVNTVNSVLKKIYKKLGVHGKAQLSGKDF